MTYKILYVDDEPDIVDVIKQRLRRHIRKGDVEVSFADNGYAALECLEEIPYIQIVFTDINMPQMDGLELIRNITEKYPDVLTVIVSAYDDMKNIRTAMNRGAYDFVTKPIDFKDFENVLARTIRQTQEREKARETQRALASIHSEMDYAGRLQNSVLPSDFSPNDHYKISARMTAARDVGGDFYDVFMPSDNSLGFLIADVSGKGISAAIFMAISRTIFHVTAHSQDEPSAKNILTAANKMICKDNHDSFFVTLQCFLLNIETGELRYANAGHMPPILIKQNGSSDAVEMPCSPGMVVGIVDDYQYEEFSYTMQPGDTIYLYTDGISEANDEEGKIYSTERLISYLNALSENEIEPGTLLDSVHGEIIKFRGAADQYDDITQLVLKYLGPKT